jgi:hypothetical protein
MAMQFTKRYEPVCMLAHDLVNQLAIIVGHCDLLLSEESKTVLPRASRLRLIRDAAQGMAKDLSEHQCQLTQARCDNIVSPVSERRSLALKSVNALKQESGLVAASSRSR